MGNCLRFLMNRLRRHNNSKRNIVLMMTGLDNAGKTSVLNRISNVTDDSVMPTMGFRVVPLRHKSFCIKVYDIGGAPQIRSIWRKYYNDIHGLIYVVDASDISRLTENKIVFGELIGNEHIAGKPILLLANKQDVPGAIDELDVVENLDVERAANAMRCPTRVETCACVFEEAARLGSTMGIVNGYKWLLDTISRNYATLDHRIKVSQVPVPVNNHRRPSIVSMTPSRGSIRSNPFKPIGQLVGNSRSSSDIHNNHLDRKTRLKRFLTRNKTAPMPPGQSVSRSEDALNNPRIISTISRSEDALNHPDIENIEPFSVNEEVALVTLDPLNLVQTHRPRPTRPFTAPPASNFDTFVQNIPGQVPQ